MSSWPPPRVLVPIFNADNYQFSALGLTEAQADLLYVRLNAPSQSINGSLGVSNLLTAGTFSAPSNTGATPAYTFNGHSDTGLVCQTAAPGEARIFQYINGVPYFQYDKSNFLLYLNFRTNVHQFLGAGGGMRYITTGTGGLYMNNETPLIFRETDVELTKPLILPASTSGSTLLGDYTIQFENENTTTPTTKFGIKARCTAPGFPAISFILNNGNTTDNEVMGFDRSNTIVYQTFRCNTMRTETWNNGMRYAGNSADYDNARTFGFYNQYPPEAPFNSAQHYLALFNRVRFHLLTPLCVSIGDTTGGNFNPTPTAEGTKITIIRRLPPATITNAGDGNTTITIGITMPNTNYDVVPFLERTSGTENWSVYVVNKTTTSVELHYCHKSAGSTTDTIVVGGYIYGY